MIGEEEIYSSSYHANESFLIRNEGIKSLPQSLEETFMRKAWNCFWVSRGTHHTSLIIDSKT